MFSGIGGFEKGIDQASSQINKQSTCVGYSEINEHAVSIYKTHFKGHKNYGDANKIIPSELENFDTLVGGFPCQAFSIAGKRKGFDDTRGTLFFEIARIAKEKQPRFLLLENVKGLLSHDEGRTFGTILSALDEVGYDVQWNVLNSKDFGVPQNRERVFIVGHLRGTGRPKVFSIRRTNSQNNEVEQPAEPVIPCLTARGAGEYHSGMQLIGRGITKELATARATQLFNLNMNGRRQKEPGEPSFTLDTLGGQGVTLEGKIRRLTPTECERLQGFPDGWTKFNCEGELVVDSQRYKCLGNAVTVNVIEHLMSKLLRSYYE